MTYEIVKFTVDLFAPGAVLSTTLTNWYAQRTKFHSCRTIYPPTGLEQLLDFAIDGTMAKQDFFHIRVTAMGDSWDGVTDGIIDHMMADRLVDDVFANELDRIAQRALLKAPPYVLNKSFVSWIELYEVDKDEQAVKFIREVSVNEIAKLITKAPTR